MEKKGEYQDFLSEFFCVTVPNSSVGESFIVALNSGTENFWRTGEESIKIFRRKICAMVPNIFVEESFTVAVISGTGNVWIGRGYQDFSSKISYLTVPNISVGESFIFALYSGTEKVWIRRWEYQDFPSRKFCLTVPKTYVGESFTVALFFGSEKVWIGGGGGVSRFSVEIFSSHGAENFGRGILYCCGNFGYRKCWDKKGGVSRFSVENFLSHGDGKTSVRESFVALI